MKIFLEIAAVCSFVGIVGILGVWQKKRNERKTQRAHWKQFDDTHHWDASADDWVPNDGQRTEN